MKVHKTQSFLAEIVWENHKKKVQVTSLAYYDTAINKFNVGDKVSLYITNKKQKRTESQNNFYWAYLTAIGNETGDDPEDLHEWAKTKCLPTEIIEIFGDKVRRKKSTTELSTGEFFKYIEKIEVATGIIAPDVRNYFDERDRVKWKI